MVQYLLLTTANGCRRNTRSVFFADGIDQRLARLEPNSVVAAVDCQRDVDLFVHHATRSLAPPSS